MNFIVGLPIKSNGNDAIWVIMGQIDQIGLLFINNENDHTQAHKGVICKVGV